MLPVQAKTIAKLLRDCGVFLLNFTVAALFTNILRNDFRLVAGMLLFAVTTIHFWIVQHGPLSTVNGNVSVYWEMSGIGCLSGRARCTDFASTLILLRTAFYSGGAWLCVWFKAHEAAALPNLTKAILSLRRP